MSRFWIYLSGAKTSFCDTISSMIKIELPWPDPILSPNARKHWARHNKAKQAAMQEAFYLTPKHKLWRDKHYSMTLTFCPPSLRRADLDNCLSGEKSRIDGIAKALGIDDSQFRPITIDWGEKVKGGKVIVEIDMLQ